MEKLVKNLRVRSFATNIADDTQRARAVGSDGTWKARSGANTSMHRRSVPDKEQRM